MINLGLLYGAIAFMILFIARDALKKYCNFDMDNIKIEELVKNFSTAFKCGIDSISPYVIRKNTGSKSLIMTDYGENKATVLATLRQITGIEYDEAKSIVNSVPTKFMTNVSDNEADLSKKALEFVGAKIEIK